MNKIKIMKKLFLFFLLCCFSFGYAKPLPPSITEVAKNALSAAQLRKLSQIATLKFTQRLKQIPQVISQPRPQKYFYTLHENTPSIQVQLHASSNNTGSALPMMVDGKGILVFPSHVAVKIKKDPYVKVRTSSGEEFVEPIQTMYITNEHNLDITVSYIPDKLKPFITPLDPAEELAEIGTAVNISGFADEVPFLLPEETVLTASPLRYVIQMRNPLMLGGACGSAITDSVTGKLLAMERDFSYNAQLAEWFKFLPEEAKKNLTNLHFAVPIQNAVAVSRAFITGDDKLAAIEMKVLGRPVALLYPNEHLSSVLLMRNGFVKQTVHFNPFLNPQKLEEFFELEPNDVLRIIVEEPATITKKARTIYYDTNVSTGKVTSFTR